MASNAILNPEDDEGHGRQSPARGHPPPPPVQNKVPFFIRACIYYVIYGLGCLWMFFFISKGFDLGDKALSFWQKIVKLCYFLVASMHTVGFGDIVPKHSGAKVAVCIVNLISFTLISELSSGTIDWIIDKLEKNKRFAQLSEKKKTGYRVLAAVFIVMSGTLMGYIGTTQLYGHISQGDSIYFVLMSLLTVGYGDLCFKSAWGQGFAIVWLGFFIPVFERSVKYLARRFLLWIHPTEVKVWNAVHNFFMNILPGCWKSVFGAAVGDGAAAVGDGAVDGAALGGGAQEPQNLADQLQNLPDQFQNPADLV